MAFQAICDGTMTIVKNTVNCDNWVQVVYSPGLPPLTQAEAYTLASVTAAFLALIYVWKQLRKPT